VTILTASLGVVCRVNNCIGALGILLRLSGGSSANLLTTCTGQCCEPGATAANITGQQLGPAANIAAVKANATLPDGGYIYLGMTPAGTTPNPGWFIPTPCVDVYMQCAVGNVTGVVIAAWPFFSDTDLRSATAVSLP
jgi:hypothetical protein